jgi:hypothetical protein
MIILGTIPGPSEPFDIDSFLYPFISEVLKTQSQPEKVPRTQECWSAIIVLVSADTKAFEKLLKIKGVNSYYGCRFCHLKGCLSPNKHVYYPNGNMNWRMRKHEDFIKEATEVELAVGADKQKLIDAYGIKGFPQILKLKSLEFPGAFPVDVMHIGFINVSKYMTKHFGGLEFKALTSKRKKESEDITQRPSYCMSDSDIKSLETDMKVTARSTPSCWGAVVPYVYEPKGSVKAEHWQIWTTILSPALLYKRIDTDALDAWLLYSNAISMSIASEIQLKSELCHFDTFDGKKLEGIKYSAASIDDKFRTFVKWFERNVYCDDPQRIHYTRIVYHYLCHIGASIEQNGPAFVYWQYPLEKLIGRISPLIKSRRFPYINFSKILRMQTKLVLLPYTYPGFSFHPPKSHRKSLFHGLEDGIEFQHPKKQISLISTDLRLLQRYYKGLYSEPELDVALVQAGCVSWNKAILSNGDKICSTEGQTSITDDGRDSNIVMLELQQDRLAAVPGRIDMQVYEIVAEVMLMVVNPFRGKEHGLALIRRIQTRIENGLLRILTPGKKEWVDMISVRRVLGICQNTADRTCRRIVVDRGN